MPFFKKNASFEKISEEAVLFMCVFCVDMQTPPPNIKLPKIKGIPWGFNFPAQI